MFSTADEARSEVGKIQQLQRVETIRYILTAITTAAKIGCTRVDVPVDFNNAEHLDIVRAQGFSVMEVPHFKEKCERLKLDTYLVTVSW